MATIYPSSSLRILATAALKRLAEATLTPLYPLTRLKYATDVTFEFVADARIAFHPLPFDMQIHIGIRGIDGGIFDQDYTSTLDGGEFDQNYQQAADAGGF